MDRDALEEDTTNLTMRRDTCPIYGIFLSMKL